MKSIPNAYQIITASFFSTWTIRVLFYLALAALLAVPAHATPNSVLPGDSFDFDLAAFNSSSSASGYNIAYEGNITFGTTQTFSGAGFDGQNITVSSNQSLGASGTTDSITLSTPANFLDDDSIGGTAIHQLDFRFGDDQPLDFVAPISGETVNATIVYGTANNVLTFTPSQSFSNNKTSLAGEEDVYDASSTIDMDAVHTFTYTVTFPASVPEPSTWALAAVGLGACVLLARALEGRNYQLMGRPRLDRRI